MSQVRKFDKGTNNGGITVLPDLFEWEGVGGYERKPMILTLTKNLAGYADYLGLTGDRRNRFMTNGAVAIKAIESGKLRRLADGSYSDTSGSNIASTGKYDKNWLGKVRDTNNNAYNDVARYLDEYLGKASVYDPEKAKKEAEVGKDKTKFSGDTFLRLQLAESLMGGNFSEDVWFDHNDATSRNQAIANLFNNADYSKIYNQYLWEGTGIKSAEDLQTRGKAFAELIANADTYDDFDYRTAAALGISNLKTFLEKLEKELTREEQQAPEKEAYIKKYKLDHPTATDTDAEESYNLAWRAQARTDSAYLQLLREAQAQEDENDVWKTFYDNYDRSKFTGLTYRSNEPWRDLNEQSVFNLIANKYGGIQNEYFNSVARNLMGKTKYADGTDPVVNNLRNLKFAWEHTNEINKNPYFIDKLSDDPNSNEWIIPGTYDGANYTAYAYNPSANSYRLVNLMIEQGAERLARYFWKLNNQKHKEGGIILLSGGTVWYVNLLPVETGMDWYASEVNRIEADKKAKQLRTIDIANPAGTVRDYTRTKEQLEAGKRQVGSVNSDPEWTTADKVRLATIGADITSTLAAFAPGYGTAASAVLGVGSTLGNLGADIADKSVSGWQAAGNAAIGLGMDVVGLIPGVGAVGKASKIAKAIKPISKGIIWTLKGIGTVLAIDGARAVQKLMSDPNSMTVDDWRALSAGILAVAGNIRYKAGKNRVADLFSQEKVRHVTGSDGNKYTISEELFLNIKGTKGFDSQNAAFREAANARNQNVPEGLKLQKEFKNVGFNKSINPKNWRVLGRSPKNTSETIYTALPGQNEPVTHWWLKFNNDNIYNTLWGRAKAPTKNTAQLPKAEPSKKPTTTQPAAIGADRMLPAFRPPSDETLRYAKASAELIVKVNTKNPDVSLQSFIDSRLPKKLSTGAVRNNRQSSYDLLFEAILPAATRTPGMSTQLFIDSRLSNAPTARLHNARQQVLDRVFNAGPNASLVVASNTKQPIMSTLLLIDSKLPKRPSSGIVRALKQLTYEELLGPVQRKDNKVVGQQKRKKTILAKKDKEAMSKNARKIEAVTAKKVASQKSTKNRFEAINRAATKNKEELSKKPTTKKVETPTKSKKRIRKGSQPKRYNEKKFGGVLEKFLSGGLIPKFQNSGVVRNTASTAKWENDIYGTDEFENWIKSYNVNNFEDFNKLQRAYATNLKNTGYTPGKSPLTYNLGVFDRQGLFNNQAGGVNSVIERLSANGLIKRYGKTGDNAERQYQDGYFGELEYLRHGGMEGMSNDRLLRLQRLADANGLEYYIDPVTKMGLLRKREEIISKTSETPSRAVSTPTLDELVGPASRTSTDPIITSTKNTDGIGRSTTAMAGTGGNNKSTRVSILPEDVISMSRMIMGLRANDKAAKLAKAGMRPLLTDTWENVVSPEWDYFAQRAGENAYAGLTSFAGRARTANSLDLFAGLLEAENKGRQFITQGNLLAANRFYLTDRLRLQESDAAKARRVENANANMGRMLQVDAAKHLVDAALTTAQYLQVLAPWLSGIENQYRQNRAIQRQMDASAYLRALLASMLADFDKAYAAGDTDKTKEITDKYYTDLAEYNKNAYSSPWLFQRTTITPKAGFIFAKDGGRLTAREKEVIQRARDFNKRMLADNKQFHKDIMESKREHNKLIAGMSNLTADLIKNGMKWK